MFSANEDGFRELLGDPRTMLGLSDGGAHVDMLIDAGYMTYLLGKWVRERQALTLEHAIKRITRSPPISSACHARTATPRTRGRRNDLRSQHRGLGATRHMQYDLPGGGRRLVMQARGMNVPSSTGSVLYREGKATRRGPGWCCAAATVDGACNYRPAATTDVLDD